MLMLILLKVTNLEVLTVVEGLVNIINVDVSEGRLNIDDRGMVLISTHSLHHTQCSIDSASVSSFSVPVSTPSIIFRSPIN